MPVGISTQETEAKDYYEVEASLDYTVNVRLREVRDFSRGHPAH